MSFLAYFESKKNIVFNLRFSVIPRICQSSVGRQSCYSLYNALVRSNLEYNTIIWCPLYQNAIHRIEKIQRKFIKFACYSFILIAITMIIRCDQLKNKSSRRVTYGNPCYSIGSKANSIYFLNDRSVYWLILV
jgi:hypothetical protein